MLRGLSVLARWLEMVLHWAVAVTVAGVVILVFADVVGRYVTRTPTYWNSEVARLLLIWMTYLGAAVLVRRGALIRIDITTARRSGRLVRAIEWMGDLITAIVLVCIGVFSKPLLAIAAAKVAPATGWSYQAFYFCLPVFSACGVLFLIDRALNGAPENAELPAGPGEP